MIFSSRLNTIIAHVVGWILFFILIIAFVYSFPGSSFSLKDVLYPSLFLFFTIYIVLFYFNTAFLFPKLYLQKQYLAYVLIILFLFLLVFYLQPFDRLVIRPTNFSIRDRPPRLGGDNFGPPPFEGPQGKHIDIVSIILFLMIISLSTVSSLVNKWRQSEKKAAQAETEKAQAALSFLKAQINPHFLFNTLNNIYVLAVAKDDQAPQAVMKLSNIMRYVTDEVSEDYVALEKEVACAKNYIDLQYLRLNEKAQIDFKVEGTLAGKKIPPLIFMTFIENAFKYGISSHEPSTITIHISSDEQKITLLCRNQIFAHFNNLERAGIGIANTKQRLEYLYPGKHSLNITQENGFYSVHLIVQE